MKCDVIQDLIPLYIDGCCSTESIKLVEAHLEGCDACRSICDGMKSDCGAVITSIPPVKMRKIDNWKASILQSLLLFASFAVITVGVALEAGTPAGLLNGFWAMNLVIPATGLLLSLANWYFVGVYKSRKAFSNCSLFATLGITLGAYIWAGFHYEVNLIELYCGESFAIVMERLHGSILLDGLGIILTIVCCILSKTLSNWYARMMGKE